MTTRPSTLAPLLHAGLAAWLTVATLAGPGAHTHDYDHAHPSCTVCVAAAVHAADDAAVPRIGAPTAARGAVAPGAAPAAAGHVRGAAPARAPPVG